MSTSSAGWATDDLCDVGRKTHGGLSQELEEAILRRAEESSKLSTCSLAIEMNASSSTIHRLSQEGLYPRYTTVQDPLPEDLTTQ
ncbi:hypothetical protein TNCT_246371 [Trichonephila clavata]|uniref:Uncharacterized protein n=1 Tax=Trichonephila clavata TaxID=2740835 RepID=A0A8X6GY32_TRICU|nr:hypothetical protein TNCT_246371 [Trichonephila clavata]